jgi:hypothetical protein
MATNNVIIPDAIVKNCGTTFLICPQDEYVREWLLDNVQGERTYYGKNLSVEHRFIEDIVKGMREFGFEVVCE